MIARKKEIWKAILIKICRSHAASIKNIFVGEDIEAIRLYDLVGKGNPRLIRRFKFKKGFFLLARHQMCTKIVQLEEGMEFSLRKGGIRGRKITFSQLEKKVLGSKQKKREGRKTFSFYSYCIAGLESWVLHQDILTYKVNLILRDWNPLELIGILRST